MCVFVCLFILKCQSVLVSVFWQVFKVLIIASTAVLLFQGIKYYRVITPHLSILNFIRVFWLGVSY